MSFPNRTGRAGFGPTLKNASPVKNPAFNPDADKFNLAFFQIAGAGLMVPRAWIAVDGSSGSSVSLVARAESWNPDAQTSGNYAAPALAYVSPGVYTITYALSYPDMNGSLVTLAPIAIQGTGYDSSEIRPCPCTVAIGASVVITTHLQHFSAGTFSAVDGKAFVWFF